jgi:hypothetical protein
MFFLDKYLDEVSKKYWYSISTSIGLLGIFSINESHALSTVNISKFFTPSKFLVTENISPISNSLLLQPAMPILIVVET